MIESPRGWAVASKEYRKEIKKIFGFALKDAPPYASHYGRGGMAKRLSILASR